MCGIIFFKSKRGDSGSKSLFKRFKNQKSRGTEGFGYAKIRKDGLVESVKRDVNEAPILKSIKEDSENGVSFLFHHRKPTLLPNMIWTTHPFVVRNDNFEYDYIIAINGFVSNYKTLYKEYEKAGYTFLSKCRSIEYYEFENIKENNEFYVDGATYGDYDVNDSEVFAIDIAEFLEKKHNYIRSCGGLAFIGLQVNKKTKKVENIIYGRNSGRPLVLEQDNNVFCVKSEGHGTEIDTGIIYKTNFETYKTEEIKVPSLYYTSYNDNKTHTPSNAYSQKTIGFGEDKKTTIYIPTKHDDPSVPPDPIDDIRESKITTLAPIQTTEFVTLDDLEIDPEEILQHATIAINMGSDIKIEYLEELLGDLEIDLKHESDAVTEIMDCIDLLRSAPPNIHDTEYQSAVHLLNDAKITHRKAVEERNKTLAEIEGYVNEIDMAIGKLGNYD